MRYHSLIALFSSLVLTTACGDAADDDGGGGGGGNADAGMSGGADGGGGDEFEILASGEWSLEAGTEDYICIYYTMPETVWVKAFRPLIPEGTHHTVVTKGSPTRADGVVPCEPETNYLSMVFGSGVGTNALHFPEGVAIKLEKGEQILINLHLFNVSDQTLSGTSGTEIIPVAEADVEFEAEALMVSQFQLNLPPNDTTTVTGGCRMNGDVDLISVSPHMHQLGTHMKVVAESSTMGDVTMLDAPYSFDEQTIRMMNPEVEMKQGDRVRIECTFFNSTDETVTWGDSSTQEMCIAGLYRYPARGAAFICSESF